MAPLVISPKFSKHINAGLVSETHTLTDVNVTAIILEIPVSFSIMELHFKGGFRS